MNFRPDKLICKYSRQSQKSFRNQRLDYVVEATVSHEMHDEYIRCKTMSDIS